MDLRLRLFSREQEQSVETQRYEHLCKLWRVAGISPIPLQELDEKMRSSAIKYDAPVLSTAQPRYFSVRVFAEPALVHSFERETLAKIKTEATNLFEVNDLVRACEDMRSSRYINWFDSRKAVYNDFRIETVARQLETVRMGPDAPVDFSKYVVAGQSPRAEFDPRARELRYTIRPRGLCVIS